MTFYAVNIRGACGDPGIFVRGVKVSFFSPQLILQKSNGQFQRNLSFSKVPEGVQHFPRGPTFYKRGPIAYSL